MATRNTKSGVIGDNSTATHLSTNIVIKVDNYIVGAVQKLDITESRNIKMVDEIGTDGHIDSAPISSTNITGSCERIRFNKQRIAEAFGRGYVHAHAQRIPFDIEIHDFFHDADKSNAIITVLKNVWIKEIRYGFSADQWIISETMSFEAEAIKSILNSNNVVSGVSNGQEGSIFLNQYEQEADRGVYRGALDAAGVLNAFLDDPPGRS